MQTSPGPAVPRRSFLARHLVDAPGGGARAMAGLFAIFCVVEILDGVGHELIAPTASGLEPVLVFATLLAVVSLFCWSVAALRARAQPDWRGRDALHWRRAADLGPDRPPPARWPGPGHEVRLQLPVRQGRRVLSVIVFTGVLVLIGVLVGNGSLPWFVVLAVLYLVLQGRRLTYHAVLEADGTLLAGARPFARRVDLSQAMVRTRLTTRARTPELLTLEVGEPGRRPVSLVLASRSRNWLRVHVDPAALPVLGAGLATSVHPGTRACGRALGRLRWPDGQGERAWDQLGTLLRW